MRLLPLILATLVLPLATAADLELPSGRILKNYKVIAEDPQWLMIMHSEGVDNFDFFELPKPLREEYGYSPAKAQAAKEAVMRAKKTHKANAAAKKENTQLALAKTLEEKKAIQQAEGPQKTKSRTPSAADVFRDEINKPVQSILPGIDVTYDTHSQEARDLYDNDYSRYRSRLEREAQRHQSFLRALTGEKRLAINKYGGRADNLDGDAITLTPKQWLIMATDEGNPHRSKMAAWGNYKSCKPAKALLTSITKLANAAKTSGNPNFYNKVDEAGHSFNNLLSGQANINQMRQLRAFVLAYAR